MVVKPVPSLVLGCMYFKLIRARIATPRYPCLAPQQTIKPIRSVITCSAGNTEGSQLLGITPVVPATRCMFTREAATAATTGRTPPSVFMASLGACPEAGNFDTAAPFVFVNEVTTVAAAYAMAGIATDATHAVSSHAASMGMANAADLANIATGVA